jgi:hypothetical protein
VAVIGLTEARAICRIPTGDTTNDALLTQYAAAVCLVVDHLVGRQTSTQVTQKYDGGNAGILLPSNLISVDTVVEDTITLTTADYTVDLRACILYRGSPLAVFSFIPGIQNISVTFTTGVAATAANVLTGAELILRHFWQGTQQGARPQFGAADSSTVQVTNVLGYLIPNVAIAFLSASPPQPGFA